MVYLATSVVHEEAVNKFLVDTKGVLLLGMFGLPSVYHLSDPVRGGLIPCVV